MKHGFLWIFLPVLALVMASSAVAHTCSSIKDQAACVNTPGCGWGSQGQGKDKCSNVGSTAGKKQKRS